MDKEKGLDRDLLLANSNVMSAVAVVAVIGLMLMPVSPLALDLLITINIAFAVVILLVALYLKEPLQFSSFPSLLLMVTLYRLSLNIASTRLILGKGGAGKVIQSFGDFVVGGNYVIGVIIFAILVIVQFVVITKGSGRIAEVAARFTLDAMPGKQMAIDADLNAGMITERQARERREKISSEAEFFGAMDGASKFVRGDAIAGIIITLINIVAGFIIGMTQMGLSAGDSVRQFTILTVGDGLVSQLPALLISTAAGMVVTRQSSNRNMGQAMAMQLFREGKAAYLAGGSLIVFGLIPGLPTFPFVSLGLITMVVGRVLNGRVGKVEEMEAQERDMAEAVEAEPETGDLTANELYVMDDLELEMGYGLLPMVDEKRGGDLLQRISKIRRQISAEMGMAIKPLRIRDNLQLEPTSYVIKLKGVEIDRAAIQPDRLLAMSTTASQETFGGAKTIEPAFKLPALWIDRARKTAAEMEGFTVVEPTAVLATHLSEIIKAHADELLSRQDVKDMCEQVRQFAPSLIEDLIPDKVPINTLHNVLKQLVHERLPIKDITTILETIANHHSPGVGTDYLCEKTHEALRRTISSLYVEPDGFVHVISLHPSTEQYLARSVQDSERAGTVMLEPAFAQKFLERLEATLQKAYRSGTPPVLLVPTPIRLFVKRLIEPTLSALAVVGYTEITSSARIKSAGTINVQGVTHEHEAVG